MEKSIQDLLNKYREGTITETEKDELYSRISDFRGHSTESWSYDELSKDMETMSPTSLHKRKPFYKQVWIRYAASIVLVAAAYMVYQYVPIKPESIATLPIESEVDKAAGVFKAYIKGENEQNYTALDSSSMKISGLLTEQEEYSGESWQLLHTPKGTEFKVELEDGSVLWLSPESSLRFPNRFTATKREVFVEGEVLFQVAHQHNKPFYVHTDQQHIEVKGTLFNVKSDNQQTITTLIDGAVWASNKHGEGTIVLKPGQSIAAQGDNQRFVTVSIPEILAWRDGFFYFEDKPLEEVLQKIAQWYNVKIDRGNVDTSVKLNGRISKKKSLMDLARVFTLSTGIQFRLVNNTLVLKKG